MVLVIEFSASQNPSSIAASRQPWGLNENTTLIYQRRTTAEKACFANTSPRLLQSRSASETHRCETFR